MGVDAARLFGVWTLDVVGHWATMKIAIAILAVLLLIAACVGVWFWMLNKAMNW